MKDDERRAAQKPGVRPVSEGAEGGGVEEKNEGGRRARGEPEAGGSRKAEENEGKGEAKIKIKLSRNPGQARRAVCVIQVRNGAGGA